jgi:hypothetical protein
MCGFNEALRISNRIALLGMAILLFTGCPYKSEVPLVPPGQPLVNTALLGVWQVTDTNYVAQRIDFRRQDERHYQVMVLQPGPQYDHATYQFEGSLAELHGKSLILLRTVEDGKDGWYHFSYHLENRTLITQELQNAGFDDFAHNADQFLDRFEAAGDSAWGAPQFWKIVTE